MENECVRVSNLTKKYKDKIVVNDLSFEIKKQEVFGLLGHNGAGKSTTIEMILGLKKADKGEATIFGLNPRKARKQVFEKVGVQLQASNYQNNICVDEICKEMSALYKNPLNYRDLLIRFKLDKFEKAMVNKLSGGEKQKLSVVLALLSDPEVVFLDELTTGLDTAARREVWDTIRKLKENGTTICLTTHYMEEAESLCDRICLLKNGKKVVEGTVAQVIKNSPYSDLENAYLWYMQKEETSGKTE